jgi:DUF4097 and DUF4098 domain-containing protein YvlB
MKNKNGIKGVLVYVPIITIAVGMIASWVRFQAQAEQTKSKVDELKIEVKENTASAENELKDLKENNKELDKKIEITKAQQENINQKVEQIDKKTDRIIEVLLEIKEKKK